jgi:hypothetical protein
MNRIDTPHEQAAAVDAFLREHGERHGGLREAGAPCH